MARRAEDEVSAAVAQLRLGEYRLRMAMPAKAEAELRKVPSDFPQEIELVGASRVHLIDALNFQGRIEAAMAAADDLARDKQMLDKHRAWAGVKMADLLLAEGRFAEAETELGFLDALGWSPGTAGPKAKAGVSRGEMLLQQSLPNQAAQILREVIEHAEQLAPHTCNWARVRLAEALTQNWEFNEAIAVCEDIAASHAAGAANNQQLAWGYLWKGRALASRNYADHAIEAFQLANAVAHPNHVRISYEAHFALGELHRVADRHVEALEHYRAAFQLAQAADLTPDAQDWARLQVASEMRHLGMGDKAIAWLRMGIEDPANLARTDRILARRLASFLNSADREAWFLYLGDPVTASDPTASLVQAEFATDSPPASDGGVDLEFDRTYWLAQFYKSQYRYDSAANLYAQALVLAEEPRQRGLAQLGIATCNMALAVLAERRGETDTAHAYSTIAVQAGNAGVTSWTQIIVATSDAEAHEAIENAYLCFRSTGLMKQAHRFLADLIRTLDPVAETSKRAFAEYQMMQWHARNGNAVTAAQVGEAIYDRYGGSADPAVRHICAASLLHATEYCIATGQLERARLVLNKLDVLGGDRLAPTIAEFQWIIDRRGG